MKKTVLHVIESLTRGGAEVLLTESLKSITDDYRHVLVYMRPPATLLPEIKAHKVYCLNYKGKRNILSSIYRLQKIIKLENVKLIHAHHYWPTIVARMAKPAPVPLLFTVHNPLSQDAFLLNRLSLYLERLTYNKTHHSIFVSEAVLNDYYKYINVEGESTVIHNFVADEFYNPRYRKEEVSASKTALKLVAVGNLKVQKNYNYLLRVFSLLKKEKIYLDIIGDGPLMNQVKAAIKERELENVQVRGASDKVFTLLRNYDAFILASAYEGLSLAVVESMAVGLPCMLSDIASNREVAGDAALYFNLSLPEDCANKLVGLLRNQELLTSMSAASKKKAADYQKQRYLKELEGLYNQYL